MNYIILNGKKSSYVQGLMIQSLPPISKPLVRTQIEEIDGRDGDIITKLGYSAYDKPITVGLYGNYKIDDVIEYFDSEGTVIFSNEPYKFYNYQIIKEINFERLVRFKTATVTLHVQPFKYSTIEGTKTFTIGDNLLDIPDNTMQSNGVTLTVTNNQLTVNGTATKATEFYLPINKLTLKQGNYTLNALANGSRASACSIRLIQSVPSDVQSFGGGYVTLSNGQTVSLVDDIGTPTTYNYLWFYITSGTAMNFTFDVDVVNRGEQSVSIVNSGNTVSKPIITIKGTGTINLSLNGIQIFVLNLGINEEITIDIDRMDAYHEGILKNRQIIGDYDKFLLRKGSNAISWSGDVSQIEFESFSRWI